MLWFAKGFLALGIPGFDTAHLMWPHHCWTEGKNHFPVPCVFIKPITPFSTLFPLPCNPSTRSATGAALLRTRKGQEQALEFTLQNLLWEHIWERIQAAFFRSLHEMLAAEKLLAPSSVYSQVEASSWEQEPPRHKYRTSLHPAPN